MSTSLAEKRSLRACLLCSIVLPEQQFGHNGCPNCQEIFDAANAPVEEFTSPFFEGVVALIEPNDSWVAKWQRYNNFVPGMYSVHVQGQLSEEIIAELAHRKIQYVPRDGSAQDDL